MLPLLGKKKIQSVAFIWVLPLVGHNKFGSKSLPLFGVLPLLIQKKKLECMLLFGVLPLLGCCSYLGGFTPLFDQFFRKLT